MKEKLKNVSKYLMILLPFLVYLGLDFIFGIVIVLLYMQSYINACILMLITKGHLPDMRLLVNILENSQVSLTQIMLFALPVLTGIFFFFWYRKLKKDQIWSAHKVKLLNIKNIVLLLAAVCGLQLLTEGMLELILPYFGDIADKYEKLIEQIINGHPLMIFLCVVLAGPVSEELVFRGVIFQKALTAAPFMVANIIQALLFALAHMNIVQGTYAFVAGLVMGYIAYKFKSIMATIVFHILFNGFNFIITFPDTKKLSGIYIAVGLFLTIAALYFISNSNKDISVSEDGKTKMY